MPDAATLRTVINLVDNVTPGLSEIDRGFGRMRDTMTRVGGQMITQGAQMAAAIAPVAVALGGSVFAAGNFDEAMANIQAVTGQSDEEMAALSDQLLAIGTNARAGPQGVADSMYDIVGGVNDASTHMAILQAAIATSEAGNADLQATTNALISVMNSYGFAAEDAAFVSDVLTQTVGVGVGTMDEFAGALPQVAGLANSLGIGFDDLGAMMAYLTTQGNSASESSTQLASMMTAMLNPNADLQAALGELGIESGQAAIEQLGLVGAFDAVAGTEAARSKGMAALTGNVNALRGATALLGPNAKTALDSFGTGLDGATSAAREFQNQSFNATLDKTRASLSGAAIQIGNALIPALQDLLREVTPVIDAFGRFVSENPQVILAIGAIITILTGAAGLNIALGIILTSLGLIFGPVGAIALGIAAGIAFFVTFKDDIERIVEDIVGFFIEVKDQVVDLWQDITGVISGGGQLSDDPAEANLQMQWLTGTLPGQAGGGSVMPGSYLVGERGPELLHLDRGAYMTPNHQMGGMGGGEISITLNVTEGNARRAGMNFAEGFRETMRSRG